MHDELDRQIRTVLDVAPALGAYVDPLHHLLDDLPVAGRAATRYRARRDLGLLPTVDEVSRFSVRGRPAGPTCTTQLSTYRDTVDVPGPVYLLADVSTGPETLGVRPEDALPARRAAGRSPRTLDEGVAPAAAAAPVLRDHTAFQALATRSPVAPYSRQGAEHSGTAGRRRASWLVLGAATRACPLGAR